MKQAVPICIALEPASMNSMASVAFIIPPIPQTGILTALYTCHTIRRAIGLMAGPERPPVMVDSKGFRLSASMAIPRKVLTRETASAPAPSTARAISAISVTLGESLTIRVLSYTSRTASVTATADGQLTPKAMPPSFTLGQEIFSSIAEIPSSSFTRSVSET